MVDVQEKQCVTNRRQELDGINSLNVRKKRWKEFIWKAGAMEDCDNFFRF